MIRFARVVPGFPSQPMLDLSSHKQFFFRRGITVLARQNLWQEALLLFAAVPQPKLGILRGRLGAAGRDWARPGFRNGQAGAAATLVGVGIKGLWRWEGGLGRCLCGLGVVLGGFGRFSSGFG